MATSLSSFLFFFFLLVAESHAGLSPQEEYWHSAIPNTPIPNLITEILDNKGAKKNPTGIKESLDGSFFPFYGKGVKENSMGIKESLDGSFFPFYGKGAKKNPTGIKESLDGSFFPYYGKRAKKNPTDIKESLDGSFFPFYGKGKENPIGLKESLDGAYIPLYDKGAKKNPTSIKESLDGSFFPFYGKGLKESLDGAYIPLYGKGAKENPTSIKKSLDESFFPFYGAKKNPIGIKESLDGTFFPFYGKGGDTSSYGPSVTIFFQEKDLKPDVKFKLAFKRSSYKDAALLSCRDAESIPFSSSRLPEILSQLSIDPKSTMAMQMKNTLEMCELPAIVGERKHCSTSLESMADFSINILGTNQVEVISTAITKDENNLQLYTVNAPNGFRKLFGDKLVVCHELFYPYAMFFCHAAQSRGYVVDLVGEDGTKVEAVVVCHTDTKGWDPNHMAFKLLKVKPGTVPVCHFLSQDILVWSQKKQSQSAASL